MSAEELLQQLDEISGCIASFAHHTTGKHDALKIVSCLCFILRNPNIIKLGVVDPLDENKLSSALITAGLRPRNGRDITVGLLRDHKYTSFHLNSYRGQPAQAIRELTSSCEEFINAWKIATEHKKQYEFIQSCEYNDSVGCLEARMVQPKLFAQKLQSHPLFDDVMARVFGTGHDAVKTIGERLFNEIGILVIATPGISQTTPISYKIISDYLRNILCYEDVGIDPLMYDLADKLVSSCKIISRKNSGVLECQFARQDHAEFFSAIIKQHIAGCPDYLGIPYSEDGVFVVRVNAHDIKTIRSNDGTNATSTSWCYTPEERVKSFLSKPHFSKTVGSFDEHGWHKAIMASTRLPNKKEQLRQEYKKQYVCRYHPLKGVEWIDRCGTGYYSLWGAAKTWRKTWQLLPLPTHQSFTYIEPQNKNYQPGYFNHFDNPVYRIGFRVNTADAHINHMFYRTGYTYGRSYESNAPNTNYSEALPKTLADLANNTLTGDYNEVSARAPWSCVSSSVVIYPNESGREQSYTYSKFSKLAAIFYAEDLTHYLQQHKAYFQKPPVNWYPGYRVPISFWHHTSPTLYTEIVQMNDLIASSPANIEEAVLIYRIYILRDESASIDELSNWFKPRLIEWIKDNPDKTISELFPRLGQQPLCPHLLENETIEILLSNIKIANSIEEQKLILDRLVHSADHVVSHQSFSQLSIKAKEYFAISFIKDHQNWKNNTFRLLSKIISLTKTADELTISSLSNDALNSLIDNMISFELDITQCQTFLAKLEGSTVNKTKNLHNIYKLKKHIFSLTKKFTDEEIVLQFTSDPSVITWHVGNVPISKVIANLITSSSQLSITIIEKIKEIILNFESFLNAIPAESQESTVKAIVGIMTSPAFDAATILKAHRNLITDKQWYQCQSLSTQLYQTLIKSNTPIDFNNEPMSDNHCDSVIAILDVAKSMALPINDYLELCDRLSYAAGYEENSDVRKHKVDTIHRLLLTDFAGNIDIVRAYPQVLSLIDYSKLHSKEISEIYKKIEDFPSDIIDRSDLRGNEEIGKRFLDVAVKNKYTPEERLKVYQYFFGHSSHSIHQEIMSYRQAALSEYIALIFYKDQGSLSVAVEPAPSPSQKQQQCIRDYPDTLCILNYDVLTETQRQEILTIVWNFSDKAFTNSRIADKPHIAYQLLCFIGNETSPIAISRLYELHVIASECDDYRSNENLQKNRAACINCYIPLLLKQDNRPSADSLAKVSALLSHFPEAIMPILQCENYLKKVTYVSDLKFHKMIDWLKQHQITQVFDCLCKVIINLSKTGEQFEPDSMLRLALLQYVAIHRFSSEEKLTLYKLIMTEGIKITCRKTLNDIYDAVIIISGKINLSLIPEAATDCQKVMKLLERALNIPLPYYDLLDLHSRLSHAKGYNTDIKIQKNKIEVLTRRVNEIFESNQARNVDEYLTLHKQQPLALLCLDESTVSAERFAQIADLVKEKLSVEQKQEMRDALLSLPPEILREFPLVKRKELLLPLLQLETTESSPSLFYLHKIVEIQASGYSNNSDILFQRRQMLERFVSDTQNIGGQQLLTNLQDFIEQFPEAFIAIKPEGDVLADQNMVPIIDQILRLIANRSLRQCDIPSAADKICHLLQESRLSRDQKLKFLYCLHKAFGKTEILPTVDSQNPAMATLYFYKLIFDGIIDSANSKESTQYLTVLFSEISCDPKTLVANLVNAEEKQPRTHCARQRVLFHQRLVLFLEQPSSYPYKMNQLLDELQATVDELIECVDENNTAKSDIKNRANTLITAFKQADNKHTAIHQLIGGFITIAEEHQQTISQISTWQPSIFQSLFTTIRLIYEYITQGSVNRITVSAAAGLPIDNRLRQLEEYSFKNDEAHAQVLTMA